MTDSPADRPTIFALHGLGLSARLFDPLVDRLADVADLVAVDLPGFGARSTATDFGLDAMADTVLRAIRRSGASRWLLVGHSMGGKVASVVAARALSGSEPVFGLQGVVLLAGSPPTPEPMDEAQRERMLGWAREGRISPGAARAFLDANVAEPLPADAQAVVLEDLEGGAPEAWTAWFERGSRQDVSAEVGALDLPALLVAGAEDDDLGAEAQRALNGPVYPRAGVAVVDGAAHLLPLERPEEVARLIRGFWTGRASRGPAVPRAFARMLASGRTGARARAAAAARALADDPDRVPVVLDSARLARLRVLAEVLVPQEEGPPIDLAARVDAQLASGVGDGWRNPALPPDAEAYRRGLDALAALDDAAPEARRALVDRALAGEGEPTADLTAEALALWLEDAAVDLARHWLAHPATMAAIGYDGLGNGGDGGRQQGFLLTGLDERESWEPVGAGR